MKGLAASNDGGRSGNVPGVSPEDSQAPFCRGGDFRHLRGQPILPRRYDLAALNGSHARAILLRDW